MILHALKDYYDRKAADPESHMAPPGWEWKEIPFVLVLNESGSPVGLNYTVEGSGKAKRTKRFLVPKGVKKTVNISSNLLWENPEYAFGIVPAGGKSDRIAEQHAAFKQRIADLGDLSDIGLGALRFFLAKPDKGALLRTFGETGKQLLEEGANLTFQLAGDTQLISERPTIKAAIQAKLAAAIGKPTICLVTGEQDITERLHPSIKGVWGAQTSGANIVAFNHPSFVSFDKDRGSNAPVGKIAAFAYTEGINHLLGKDSKQRLQVGDASTVFWSEKTTALEQHFVDFFGEPPKDDPGHNVRAVESLFKSPHTGAFAVSEDLTTRFYVLGLAAPSKSRLTIRFWVVDTVAGMSGKLRQHFEDLQITHGPKDRDSFSLFRLLVSTASRSKSENIPPNLAGETMRAILCGTAYPQSLFQACIRRIKAEQAAKNKQTGKPEPHVSYPRAALLKACLNRSLRLHNPTHEKQITMSLDLTNLNIGYRLGRLFAALEKIQSEASPGLNATIRDKFYGAASGTPVAVFGNLMRLKNHHLAKLKSVGRRVNFERLIGEIMSEITDFPPHLTLADQGRFAIGYYHQTQDFFTKKPAKE
jgi:CRISPR-associated protein Csd1